MNIGTPIPAPPRSYRQTARAEAAAATHRRIVEAFLGFTRDRWLDEITLDEVAAAADVTVQTVIRRFGGKDGLIDAATALLSKEIPERRIVPQGTLDQLLGALVADYEITGDVAIRLLAQEDRYPALGRALAVGRAQHRAWVEEVLAPALPPLAESAREHRIAGLIATTDVYTWKLLRRDLGHSQLAAVAVMRDLARGLLREPADPPAGE